MNNKIARRLRKEALETVLATGSPQQTLYVQVDPNLAESPAFAGDPTGVKTTIQVDPTCLRGVYLNYKKKLKDL